jgi:hypothetical protein
VTSEIVWKILASLGADALAPKELAGRFFNPSVNKGLYSQFSLPLKYAYIPLSLQPNTSYDDRIRKLSLAESYKFRELKLPYSLHIADLGTCRLLLRFRIFPPNIASLTVRLKLLEKNLGDVALDSLFKYRSPGSIAEVHDVVTWSLGLVGSAATEQRSPAISTRQFFGLHFADVGPPQEIQGYWENSKRQMVGLLIGNETYTEMHDEIVSKVTRKCDNLNLKSASEYLLVNKQGEIFISSTRSSGYANKHRFRLAMDLAEIGLVFREFLDNTYPERRRGQEGFLDYVFRAMTAWITRPDAILNISYSNGLLWRLLSSEFGLTEKLELIKTQNSWLDRKIADDGEYFAQFGNRWWERPEFAAAFPPRSQLFQSFYGESNFARLSFSGWRAALLLHVFIIVCSYEMLQFVQLPPEAGVIGEPCYENLVLVPISGIEEEGGLFLRGQCADARGWGLGGVIWRIH